MHHGAIKADPPGPLPGAPGQDLPADPGTSNQTAPRDLSPSPIHEKNLTGGLADSLRSGARSALARRFVILVFALSSALAFLITLFQLTLEFRGELSRFEDTILRAEAALAPSLVESVWLVDQDLIRSHVAGLLQIEGVVEVRVETDDGARITTGDAQRPSDREYRFDIARQGAAKNIHLGSLIIRVSYDQIRRQISRLGALILLTNFLQSLAAAAFILIFYQYLVGRHLYELAQYASDYDLEATPSPVRLDRSPPKRGTLDELTMLETALSDWARANHAHANKLRSDSREQSEFNYAISHDLKSPTNTVAMLLEELRDIAGENLNEDMEEVLHDLDRTVDRMSKLIEDVLEYSRTIGEDFITAPVDLGAEVAAIVQDLSGDIGAASAEVTVAPLPVIEGNAMQLRLLFQNLISNALKFRAADRPPRIDVGLSPAEDGWLAIHVSDNGIGIQPDHFDKIFGMFQRLHTKDSYEGTGIGLTTCQRVAANHQGRIEVSSKPDAGTTFKIVLPDQNDQSAFLL
ncbi:MAG: ATP-binding protein [Silicimonas sp.]|nr:ATP-binding protein [Silicimonas sp.]